MAQEKNMVPKETLNKISRLEFKARQLVEGFLAGMHKSPYFGFSVEFASHREYYQGDDLRHLDWKVYGKIDKLFIKQYEMETNLRAFILLDCSSSMEYKSADISKLEYAAQLAAAMAYLFIDQQDACGILCFDKEVGEQTNATSGKAHLFNMFRVLAGLKTEKKTDIEKVFRDIAEKVKTKGVIVVISDLFDETSKVIKGLQWLRAKGHEIVVFNVMDEHELTFPFKRLTKFIGLEEEGKVFVDPLSIRQGYLTEVEEFKNAVSRFCRNQMIDYSLFNTANRVDVELTRYLVSRLGTKLIRRR